MRTFILFIALIFSLPLWAQGQKNEDILIEAYKEYFVNRFHDAEIDYTMSLEDKGHPININDGKISSAFAVLLFNHQKNRFCYKNKIFYWNDVPIPLFEELEAIKKKFPKKDFSKTEEDSESAKKMKTALEAEFKRMYPEEFKKETTFTLLDLANGVRLRFTKYKEKFYLTRVNVDVDYLADRKNDDYGIFMVEDFPIKKSYLDRQAFTLALEKLNEVSKYNFGYSMGKYSTSFENVKINDVDVLTNYFDDKDKFLRTQRKKIKNQILFDNVAGHFRFENNLMYEGVDPEYKEDEQNVPIVSGK